MMPTYRFKESDLPPGVTCVDLEAKWGLARGQVQEMQTVNGIVTVTTSVPVAVPTPEPPIIATPEG